MLLEKIITDLIKRSNNIKKDYFIKDEYKKYVDLKNMITNNKIVNQLPERLEKCLVDIIYSEAYLLILKDLFMCESNAELTIEGLSDT